MSKQLSFVAPEYAVVKRDATDAPVDAHMHGDTSTAHKNKTWSGAVHIMNNSYSFQHIEASWTVSMEVGRRQYLGQRSF